MDDATRPPDGTGTRTATRVVPVRDAASDHGRFTPGTLLAGRYRIVAPLGRGGMGEVYRADDLKLAQPVALKFLPEALERRPAAVDRLLAEIRTARQVTHPNVCRVHDVGDLGGRPFFSMEYVDGEDLASLLRRIGRLPRDKAVEVARQICAGLDAAHEAGILHRDLKPANIMLDGRGRVRLTDFGLGAALDEVAAGTLEVAGTPAYMAPEQLTGAALSVQTDLYALGLVLHELFTGRRVHDVRSTRELRARHMESGEDKVATDAADLDAETARVIASCLDPDPGRRPASALAVSAALPGGDPLAAALAVGRTPSPQAVAAAGAEGGLSLPLALPLLAALLGGVLLASTLQRHAFYVGQVALPHPAIVLAVKAQEMLARLGHDAAPADTAYGFREDPEYYRWALAQDERPDSWSGLSALRPPVVTFWHRGSPRPLMAASYSHMFGGLAIRPDDPPRDLSGMTYVELDPAGRLVALEVVPPQVEAPPAVPIPTPDWTRLFSEAGLDPGRFSPTEPLWIGPYADARAAWTGPSPDGPGAALRVEAAAYRGLPVHFRLVAPWTRAERMEPPPWSAHAASTWPQIVLMVGCFLIAIALARANLRRGRGDRRGAVRLAAAAGGASFASALLLTHHVPHVGELLLLIKSLALALFVGGGLAVFYLALEPYVRRRWPQVLISWMRLLAGRWRDPLVGRDLLAGSTLGLLIVSLDLLKPLASAWRGVLPMPPLYNRTVDPLLDVLPTAGQILQAVPPAIFFAMMWLALMFLMRAVLRNVPVTAIVFVAMAAAILGLTAPTDPVGETALTGVMYGAIVTVLLRLGFLATVAMVWAILAISSGYASTALIPYQPALALTWMAVSILPGLFGFYTSLAGRRMVPALLDD